MTIYVDKQYIKKPNNKIKNKSLHKCLFTLRKRNSSLKKSLQPVLRYYHSVVTLEEHHRDQEGLLVYDSYLAKGEMPSGSVILKWGPVPTSKPVLFTSCDTVQKLTATEPCHHHQVQALPLDSISQLC